MKTDPLFYALFQVLPEHFFRLIGRRDFAAAGYQLDAIEYKAASVRLDGVFRPADRKAAPAYLWEAQFHRSDSVYANLLAKVGHFLEHDGPDQDWVAVVIYPTRGVERKNLHPYRCVLNSDQFIRVYLDELPEPPDDRFDLGVFKLIGAKPEEALKRAQEMVPRVKSAALPAETRTRLLEFIETVIVYQFPDWSRERVEKMLTVSDFTQTRVYREAVEEGIEKGREQGIDLGIEKVARRMLDQGKSVAEVATATGLTAARVRRLKKKPQK